jgi:hypothetical protein
MELRSATLELIYLMRIDKQTTLLGPFLELSVAKAPALDKGTYELLFEYPVNRI